MHDVDPAQRVERFGRRGRPAAEQGRPELDEAAPDVRVGGRFDEDLEVLAGSRVEAHVPVQRFDRFEDASVRRVDERLRLEPGLRTREPEVDDELDVVRVGRPVGRHRPGDPEPDGAPRPPPRLPDRERCEVIRHGLRERHRLIRHLPRLDGDGCARPLDRRHQSFPDQPVDALPDEL